MALFNSVGLVTKRKASKRPCGVLVWPQSESVDDMRRRARHRLIGAAVLVALGVIGFPILFDTQPRPSRSMCRLKFRIAIRSLP